MDAPVLGHLYTKRKSYLHGTPQTLNWAGYLQILQVPVAAAVYYEDMYVNFNIAKETASQIAGIRLWITNEYMHSGIRDGGSHVFDHLMGLLNGKKPLF